MGGTLWWDVLGFAGEAVLARDINIMRMRCFNLVSRLLPLAAGLALVGGPGSPAVGAPAGTPYLGNKPLVVRTKELAREHKSFVRAAEVCESAAKNEVWRLELGNTARKTYRAGGATGE